MLPDFGTGGHAVRSMLATERLEPGKPGSAASVRGIYGRSGIRSTAFLQFYFAFVFNPQKPGLSHVIDAQAVWEGGASSHTIARGAPHLSPSSPAHTLRILRVIYI